MKPVTTEDLLNDRTLFTKEDAEIIKENIKKETAKIRGGKREGAGRKPVESGKVLKFTKRLSEDEVKFIDYARKHNVNYRELMEG